MSRTGPSSFNVLDSTFSTNRDPVPPVNIPYAPPPYAPTSNQYPTQAHQAIQHSTTAQEIHPPLGFQSQSGSTHAYNRGHINQQQSEILL